MMAVGRYAPWTGSPHPPRFRYLGGVARQLVVNRVKPTFRVHHAVVQQLPRVAESDIARVVRILGRMIRADREGWRFFNRHLRGVR